MESKFQSRRSVVHSTKGIVSSTQPLAAMAGIKILEAGGNAAMAAVATAAALAVLEPHMTGIGGDMFSLFYEASTKKVHGINGSGKCARDLSIEYLREHGITGPRIPGTSVHAATTPGTVAGWIDVIEKWGNGKVSLAQILQPAIDLAENGAPISSISSHVWEIGARKLLKLSPEGSELLVDGKRAPRAGEIFINKNLAACLRRIAVDGKAGFYEGPTADAIITEVISRGGVLSHEDLAAHESEFVEPISLAVDGLKLYEIPPNGQGFVALETLAIIQKLDQLGSIDLKSLKHNSVEYLHVLIETLKLSFKDSQQLVLDLEGRTFEIDKVLNDKFLVSRTKLFTPDAVNAELNVGVLDPALKSDTVYLSTTDSEGNACSFINSVSSDFGCGIVPKTTGFALQSRGTNFNLSPGAPNSLQGGRRSYHVS